MFWIEKYKENESMYENKFTLTLEDCEHTLKTLIQIDTCQPKGNEKDIIQVMQGMLPANVKSTVFDHGSNRASLFVEMEGQQQDGGIAFLGHVDTVACNNLEEWVHHPLQGVVKDGIMHGRGTADMKGGVAAMLLTMHEISRQNMKPKKPIYFCFTADEEAQGTGIVTMMEKGLLDKVEHVVVGEPSGERIGIAEKGALWLEINVHGVSAHGSRPELGVNAVEQGIICIEKLREILSKYEAHPVLGKSTMSVTKMQGGIMTNVIPCDATIEVDIRTVPQVDHATLLKELESSICKLQEERPGLNIDIKILNNRAAIGNKKDDSFIMEMYAIAEKCGINTEVKGLNYYTDASQVIPALGVPFVIAGPGDDGMAHKTNECVSLKSVLRFAQLYSDYVKEYYL